LNKKCCICCNTNRNLFAAEGSSILGLIVVFLSVIIICSAANCIPRLVQQNVDGLDFFNRSWAEYKVGFHDTRGNFWLGNDLLHQLTTSGRYKLRFDLQASNSSWYYAEYSRFIVSSEASNYLLRVSGYSGNAGEYGFSHQNGMMFTTYDRDNDLWSDANYGNNCATRYGGGFWYTVWGCSHAKVNSAHSFFTWFHDGRHIPLQTSRMWLTC